MTKTIFDVKTLLAAALSVQGDAKEYRAEDNPATTYSLLNLVHGRGVDKSTDHHPAVSMPAKTDGESTVAIEIERARRAGLEAGHVDKSAQRMATARTRAARKAQIDALVASPTIPSAERLRSAWEVVAPLSEIVDKIALSKRQWASRYLGSSVDDIGQMAIEAMVLVMAKDERDLSVLKQAAEELGGITRSTGRVPGDQLDDDELKERKALTKARKWLMGMANNRVMGALVDSYTSQSNLRWDNIDLIATVMASISGVGDDPESSRFKADRAPVMLGGRFQRPGSFNPESLTVAMNAAITERKLDRLVELLLDNTRSDGSFKWTDNAEAVFLATGGQWQWDLVVKATEKLAEPRRARADAARVHARNQFAWLPSMIASAVRAFDYERIENADEQAWPTTWTDQVNGGQRALLASEFEGYYEEAPRSTARPALVYATPAQAAEELSRSIEALTGADLVSSVVFA